jgi:hypothetical protein
MILTLSESMKVKKQPLTNVDSVVSISTVKNSIVIFESAFLNF